MIGARILQARQALGLNQRELGEKADVSAMAISKYERDEMTPSSDVLLRLAKALEVRTEYFLRTQSVELSNVNFRKHEELPERDRVRALADVRDQLERWLELEQFIPTPWSKPFALPAGLPKVIADLDEVEQASESVRDAWELGRNPVGDVVDTLESHGVKVFMTRYVGTENLNGLSARAEGKPLIIIGEGWPGDRQRFTLAHELGHIVLHDRLKGALAKDEEKACDRFAAAFLVPKERVQQALGERRTRIEPRELALLKDEWGLSMFGWAMRARDLGILPQARLSELWSQFRSEKWDVKEPGSQYRKERTRLFEQLVYRALAEDLIGESKAAELLGMSVAVLRKARHMEAAPNAAHQ
jgi:Zn-dependent peptidase ImmA (M78 family)/DNA-binding XRE family transcriptional regulator